MNYQKIYDDLIIKILLEHRVKLKKKEEGYVYYEEHHIIPRCMHGPDVKENLLLVTNKEHYFFHKLLTYIFKGNKKLIYSFFRMTFNKKTNQCFKTSRDYAYARELSKELEPWNKGGSSWNKGLTKEDPRVAKYVRSGDDHFFTGKHHTKKAKEKCGEQLRGKTYEEVYGEEKAKVIKNKRSIFWKDRKKSEEQIEKAKQTHKNKWKTFIVKCHKCGKEIEIKEYNVSVPKKEKYFCSRSCANSHIVSRETAQKISKTKLNNNKKCK